MNRLLIFFMILLAFSCDDIFETDISDDMVVLRTPSEGYATSSQSITFWWDSLEGADEYELQVVSPDMATANVLVIDTVIVKTQFAMTLTTGQYEWCVKGMNNGYETALACRSLEITN